MLARETKGESERQLLSAQIVLRDKLVQAGGDVVEQLIARPGHDVLGDGEDLGVHAELFVGTDVDQEDSVLKGI